MLHLIFNIIKNVNSYRRGISYQVNSYIQEKDLISMTSQLYVSLQNQFTKVTPCQTHWLKLTILFTEAVGRKDIAETMLKSSLFILFCETDVDFHQ